MSWHWSGTHHFKHQANYKLEKEGSRDHSTHHLLTPSDKASKYSSPPILDKQWIALANTAESLEQKKMTNERFISLLTHHKVLITCILLIVQESHSAS